MKIVKTHISEVLHIYPQIFDDDRGFFLETYSYERYKDAGVDIKFVQDNHSHSEYSVLRGLHYQLLNPQGKLVYVLSGEVYDVAVDIRVGSPTFGQHVTSLLTAGTKNQLWIPPGFAHGFCVVSDTADFIYKCTDLYNPNDQGLILWNDPELDISWPVSNPILSSKDSCARMLSQIPLSELPVY